MILLVRLVLVIRHGYQEIQILDILYMIMGTQAVVAVVVVVVI